MKLTKKEWFVACLPAILFLVVLSWAMWSPRVPEATQEQTVNIDNATVANWIYQEPANNIEGDNMADIEVTGAGTSAANGIYVDQGDDGSGFGNHRWKSANGSAIFFDFGGGQWLLYDNNNTPLYAGGAWQNDGDNNPTSEGGAWSVDMGDSPAPTVAFATGGSSDLKIVMRNGQKYAAETKEGANIIVSDEEPEDPSENDIWIDIS